jgi:hypothetical protein
MLFCSQSVQYAVRTFVKSPALVYPNIRETAKASARNVVLRRKRAIDCTRSVYGTAQRRALLLARCTSAGLPPIQRSTRRVTRRKPIEDGVGCPCSLRQVGSTGRSPRFGQMRTTTRTPTVSHRQAMLPRVPLSSRSMLRLSAEEGYDHSPAMPPAGTEPTFDERRANRFSRAERPVLVSPTWR